MGYHNYFKVQDFHNTALMESKCNMIQSTDILEFYLEATDRDKIKFMLSKDTTSIIYMYTTCIQKNMSLFYSDFTGNLHARKPNIAHTKKLNIMGVYYFCTHQQVVKTSYFILYPIFILLPHYLLQLPLSPPPPPTIELPPPPSPAQAGIINSNTVSSLTSGKVLANTKPIHQPSRFQRRICSCVYHCFRKIPTYPLTLDICCRHHR